MKYKDIKSMDQLIKWERRQDKILDIMQYSCLFLTIFGLVLSCLCKYYVILLGIALLVILASFPYVVFIDMRVERKKKEIIKETQKAWQKFLLE